MNLLKNSWDTTMETNTNEVEKRKKLIQKIKLLLEKAQGTSSHDGSDATRAATEREQSLAMEAAYSLMRQHNIEAFEIMGEKAFKSDCTHGEVYMGTSIGRAFDWCLTFAKAVNKLCFTDYIYYSKKRTIVFIGSETEVTLAKELYQWFVFQAKYMCRYARKRAGIASNAYDAIKFNSDYMSGCAYKVQERAKQIALENAQTGMALVPITTERNAAYTAETFGDLNSRKRREREVSKAMREGYKDGDRVNLHKSKEIKEQEYIGKR